MRSPSSLLWLLFVALIASCGGAQSNAAWTCPSIPTGRAIALPAVDPDASVVDPRQDYAAAEAALAARESPIVYRYVCSNCMRPHVIYSIDTGTALEIGIRQEWCGAVDHQDELLIALPASSIPVRLSVCSPDCDRGSPPYPP